MGGGEWRVGERKLRRRSFGGMHDRVAEKRRLVETAVRPAVALNRSVRCATRVYSTRVEVLREETHRIAFVN